jgi:type IV pilus biogenesis protein PilP
MAVVRLPNRAVHALAFAETAVTLLRHEAGHWTAVEHVAIDRPDFARRMADLASSLGKPSVVLWLPAEHVLSLRHGETRDGHTDRPGLDARSLTVAEWVGVPPPDGPVLLADTDTIGEAIGHARGWGFRPQAVSVNPGSIPPGSTLRFPHADLPQRPQWRLAASLAAALILAAGVAIWSLQPPDEAPPPSTAEASGAASAVAGAPPRVAAIPAMLSPILPGASAAPQPLGPEAQTVRAPAPITRPAAGAALPSPPEHPAVEVLRPESDTPPTARLAGLAPVLRAEAAALLPRLPNDAAMEARPPAAPRQPSAPAMTKALPAPDTAPDPNPQTPADTPSLPAEAAVAAREAGSTPPVPPARSVEGAPARLATILPPPRSVVAVAEPDAETAAPRVLRAPRPALRPARPAVAAPAPERAPAAAQPVAPARRTLSAADARSTTVTANPQDVTRLATIRGALPAGQAGLIGVFGEGSNRQALLRLADGRIQRVNRGDRVEGWTVSAIDDSSVRLSGPSGGRTLHVPSR